MINDYCRLHHDNKNVIRNFLFLGFQPIAPGNHCYLFMTIMVTIVVIEVILVIVVIAHVGLPS